MDSIIVSPAISVIMPVYNAGAFLKDAIDSILQQSFTDFEFFIIDDASTDNSVVIIQYYTDKRIQFIQKPTNTGYTDSLNMAVQLAKGKYIARMDADDISLPERFKQQFQYMEEHPHTLLLGSAYKIIGTGTIIQLPLSCKEANVVSIMHSPVAHPTVMMRKDIFSEYKLFYNKKYEPAEDFDLWTRVLEIGLLENLPEPLLHYRHHQAQQSFSKYDKVIEVVSEIRLRQLNKLISFEHKPYDISFAIDVLTKQPVLINVESIKKLAQLIADMMEGNTINDTYDETILAGYLKERWLFYISKFANPALKDISLLIIIRRCAVTRMSYIFNLKYLVKCFLFR